MQQSSASDMFQETRTFGFLCMLRSSCCSYSSGSEHVSFLHRGPWAFLLTASVQQLTIKNQIMKTECTSLTDRALSKGMSLNCIYGLCVSVCRLHNTQGCTIVHFSRLIHTKTVCSSGLCQKCVGLWNCLKLSCTLAAWCLVTHFLWYIKLGKKRLLWVLCKASTKKLCSKKH